MFEVLSAQPADAIIALMEQAKADTNPDKIDLGVGVYKSEDGATPIMRAVREAEKQIYEIENTKSYVSTAGNAAFRRQMEALIFGAHHPALVGGRIASAQAVGGSGALRLGAELIRAANPEAVVWVSTPTWANHTPLISAAGLNIQTYPYYNRETLSVDFDDMLALLKNSARRGDVVLLHGCCHNPTGADLSPAQWDVLSAFLADHGLIPFVDLAYFGLGRGMAADTYGLLKVVEHNPETILAASCSKNFALYKERVGLVAVIAGDADQAKIVQSQLGILQRRLVSMPPDHGAALVAHILGDAALRNMWQTELDAMRARILQLRADLAQELSVQGREDLARAIETQNGMFSMLPVTKTQAEALRSEYSVYMTNTGRINIAGANADNIPRLARAVLAVL